MIQKCSKCGKEFKCININLSGRKHPCDLCNKRIGAYCPFCNKQNRKLACFNPSAIKEQFSTDKIDGELMVDIAMREMDVKKEADKREDVILTELKCEV